MSEDVALFEEAHPLVTLTCDEGETVEIAQDDLPRLLNRSVLLQPFEPPKKTTGGIYLPETVQDAAELTTYVFRVLKLGPLAFASPQMRGGSRTYRSKRTEWRDVESMENVETWREDEQVDFAPGQVPPEIGDWVVVRQFAGINLRYNGGRLRLCDDRDILIVLPKGPAGWQAYF